MALQRVNIGVLGCTGAVGARMLRLLCGHPYFKVNAVGASARSASRPLRSVLRQPMPATTANAQNQHEWESILDMNISECTPDAFQDCDLVLSALDSSVAGDIESSFAKAGLPVFTNARNHRMGAHVPLVTPLVNPDHIEPLIATQKAKNGSDGFIVTNPNCTTTGLVNVLKPLHDAFGGIEHAMVFSMQAVSGAGFPGLSSMSMIDNVVPFIDGEEEKLESEPRKLLGNVVDQGDGAVVDMNPIKLAAHCNRVPVTDGHTETASIAFKKPPPSTQEIIDVLRSHRPSQLYELDLPSLPPHPIHVFDAEEPDRPQPRLDRERGNGFTTSVGRIRPCTLMDYRLSLVSHNTIIGAAGGSLLNAEYAFAAKLL